MDPQDLLYTNQFITTDILTKKELQDGVKYYENFQNNIDKKSNITKEYLNRNLKDKDPINVNKVKSRPWPPADDRNYKPIFSNAVSDVVENKYIKSIKTILSIYSKDRNKQKAVIPNDFDMNMGKQFINIYKIKLIDFNIPNSIPPVNITNNIIEWVYPTLHQLNISNTGKSLYPFVEASNFHLLPRYFFYYSNYISGNLPKPEDSVIKLPEDLYAASIDLGFFTTSQMENNLEKCMNRTLHTIKEGIVSSFHNFDSTAENYSPYSRLLRNTPHKFKVQIDPTTTVCTFINRAEDLCVIAIQTLPQQTMCSEIYNATVTPAFTLDIFLNFHKTPPTASDMTKKYLFDLQCQSSEFLKSKTGGEIPGAEIKQMTPSFIITVKNIGDIFGGILNTDLQNPCDKDYIQNFQYNAYPLIFTDMPSIGGIDKNLINYVEFYDYYFICDMVSKDTFYNSSDNYVRLSYVPSFYYYFDDIKIGNETFKRYAFFIHTNSFLKRPGYYFRQAGFINCNTQETVIYSSSLNNVLNNTICCKEDIDNATYYGEWKSIDDKNKNPICGRGLPFAFKKIIDKNNSTDINCISKRISILSILGWSTDENDINFSVFSPVAFIHRNIDTVVGNIEEYSKLISDKDLYTPATGLTSDNICPNYVFNFSNIPQNLIDLELLSNGTYVFRSLPFLFLKITFPSLPPDTVANQLIRTTSDKVKDSVYEDFYENPLTNLNDIGANLQEIPLVTREEVVDDPLGSQVINQALEKEKDIYNNCGFKTNNMLLPKNTNVIFAKINLNSIPGNAYSESRYEYDFTFYDKPLQEVNVIHIELLSPDGRLLNLRQEFNLTLEVMEFRDVLKETLFDTRQGEVVTTGIKKI